LAEIGVFVKAVYKAEQRKHLSTVSEIFLGTNLSDKGYKEFISSFETVPTKKEVSQTEVDEAWRGLQSFMQGLR
jgi:hypothetical protein